MVAKNYTPSQRAQILEYAAKHGPTKALAPRGPPDVSPETGRLVADPVLGGLHHDYELVA